MPDELVCDVSTGDTFTRPLADPPAPAPPDPRDADRATVARVAATANPNAQDSAAFRQAVARLVGAA